MTRHLSALLTQPNPPPFALVRREGRAEVELLLGDVVDVERLADIPMPDDPTGGDTGSAVLALVPYRQVIERGFTCHDDATPLRCLLVRDRVLIDVDDCLATITDERLDVSDDGFDVDDNTYAGIVGDVIRDEIGRGEGANFVIRRDFQARVHGIDPHVSALRLFRRLLAGEPNAYWTFAVHAGDVTMVGATPERHVSVSGGTVVMNPISGTYVPAADEDLADGLLRFLADPKETEELFMVVDEELKMMSHVCPGGGRVLGPFLKEMGHLVHTEYLLEGETYLDVRDVLRETMFAPTVTGSPVENAARVIARHEPSGRGYYAGVAALLERDESGRVNMDAPILIRTAYLDPSGRIRIPVGATLVRHSVARNEIAETHGKAAGVLAALGVRPRPAEGGSTTRRTDATMPLTSHPSIVDALAARNNTLAPFWLRRQAPATPTGPFRRSGMTGHPAGPVAGHHVLIADAEDGWTAMLAHLFRQLGVTAEVCRWHDVPSDTTGYDLVVAGPGPGDPRDLRDPRIGRLDTLIRDRLATGLPLLAVCLSHQILAAQLGLPLARLAHPYQGTQRDVDIFGRRTRVGFYNTFAAWLPDMSTTVPTEISAATSLDHSLDDVQIAAASRDGEVYATRGPGFASVQFHLESILSVDGIALLEELTWQLIGESTYGVRGT